MIFFFCCDPNKQNGSNTQNTRRPPRLYSDTLSHYGLLSNSKLLPSNNITSQHVGYVQKSHCSKKKKKVCVSLSVSLKDACWRSDCCINT